MATFLQLNVNKIQSNIVFEKCFCINIIKSFINGKMTL